MIRSPFEAIADPTRRAILDRLAESGPRRAGDLAKQFPGMSRPAVSKHLRVLRSAKMVRQEPRGREVWYILDASPLIQINEWLIDYEHFWQNRLERLKKSAENSSVE